METLIERDNRVIADIQKLRFFPNTIVAGQGVYLIEEDGRKLLDLSATWGAASLGYGYPTLIQAVTSAIRSQAGASILSAVNKPAVELAEKLISTVPEARNRKVWLGHSGSDANDAMMRAVLAATGRSRIISFIGAYHGGTSGSMSISGHTCQTDAPKFPGALFLPYPNPYRPIEGDTSGTDVLNLLDNHLATDCPPEEVAALFYEPLMSDGGLIVPPEGFLKRLEDRLRPHGVLFVCDEVKVGLARTGRMYCHEHENLTPDIITLGKGLGGGLPLSAAIGPAEVLDVAQAFAMETTCGNPISATAGLAVLEAIRNNRLDDRAAKVGGILLSGLKDMAGRRRSIGDVRGRGLALGVELIEDPDSRKPAATKAAKVVYRAYELGVVVYYVGMDSNVLELTPPLILTESEATQALDILDRAIADVEQGRVSDDVLSGFQGW